MDDTERAAVGIIGAGVAGLTLANMLLRNGIACIIVERHSRDQVEHRQRAGALDGAAVEVLTTWGLDDVIEGQPVTTAGTGGAPLRIDGQPRPWLAGDEVGADGVFCPQQVLVRNLITAFLRDGGDLRFDADQVHLDLDGVHPRLHYRDAGGAPHTIDCDYIAGCDGDRGVSRRSIPPGAVTSYCHEHGYAWLAMLAEIPADPPAVMAIHDRGFSAQITRGPNASRLYLQCLLTDTIDQWPDDRVWNELETRFGTPLPTRPPITDKQIVPIRSVVHAPMSYRRLFLLGDAAHIVSPMSAKGMSLALHDADVFARAVMAHIHDHDPSLLHSYSPTCLSHIWNAQISAMWITEVMHNAGDASYAGEFRRQLARAELDRMIAG
ncbi:4-hydroxybenzoate 3-monooxygenase [Mycolicibacterium litorale]|nr:4-hydroxybenzoate 3-monooxygenase [Mycolicibacterium litorale]